MTRIRALPMVATLGLTLLTTASSSAAHVIEALTSIPADRAVDKETPEKAVVAGVDDVAAHAVAFIPTVVSLREAKIIGDRIYLFVLLADADGEAEIQVLGSGATRPDPGPPLR